MSEATSQTLLRAYELIEADEHEEARELLEPVLATDPDNADAWWLYAHAVTTPEEAQSALSNLMRVAPNYPGAAELNARVRSQLPERQPAAQFEQRSQTTAEREVNATFGRFLRWVILIGVVVAVLIIAFLLLSDTGEDGDNGEQLTSAVASIPTLAIVTPMEQETAEAQIVITEDTQGTQIEATSEEAIPESVLSAFSTFELADEATTVVDDVVGGRTLLVGVCANDAPLDLIDQAMQTVASVSATVTSVDAIGVRVYDCASGDVINSLAVDLEVAQQFNDQTIDLRGYQSQWRVLG